MSKNISNLSGRIGLKDNLFKKMSENVLNDSPKDIKEIAKEYNLGVSTIHGAESFYEFLRPSHREKKAFVCNGSACMCAGTQDKLKETLKSKLGDDKVGEMFCLGYCYENHAFHYDGENYAGNDISKIDKNSISCHIPLFFSCNVSSWILWTFIRFTLRKNNIYKKGKQKKKCKNSFCIH